MQQAPLTVLVVVRDAATVRQLAQGLLDERVQVVAAPHDDPPAVVAVLRRAAAAAVLVELDLPHAGALAVLSGLRASPGVPVLLFSGRPVPLALRPAFEHRAAGCVAGQLQPRRLAAALRSVVRGEPVLSHALTSQLLRELAAPGARSRPLAVTPREREVLGLLAEGRRTAEVAIDLALSKETVRGHVKSALRKLGVRTCAAAVALLVAERMTPTLHL